MSESCVNLCSNGSFEDWIVNFTSQYPTLDTDHVKATSYYSSDYYPHYACDNSKSVTGQCWRQGWMVNATTNQRFHIDLGTSKVIKRIYYENEHETGTLTSRGVKNFTLWGSNNADDFNDLTYANNGTWTSIPLSWYYFDRHIDSNQSDPKYFVVYSYSVAYRYYALKFADTYGGDVMAVRRIELQEENFNNPEGFDIEGTPYVVRDIGDIGYGNYSAKITAIGSGLQGINKTLTGLKPSTTYTVSWRTKVTSGDTSQVLTIGAGTNMSAVESNSTSFETKSGSFITDNSGSNVTLKFLSKNDGDVVWFDGIQVNEGETVYSFTNPPIGLIESFDYAENSIIVGWSTITSKTIRIFKIGKFVFVSYYITGTSNDIKTSFTVPYIPTNWGNARYASMSGKDNGSPIQGGVMCKGTENNVMPCYSNGAGGGWTASGDKTIFGQIWFEAI